MALLATLTDDFSGTTLDTSKWTVLSSGGGSTYSVASSLLTLTTGTASTAAEITIQSAASYDARNSSVVAKVSFPTSTGSSHFRRLTLTDSTHVGYFVRIELRSATVYLVYAGSGGTTYTTSIGTYNASTMAYWRIRCTADTFYYGFSSDGVTFTDTQVANQAPTNAFASYAAVNVQLQASNNSTATASSMAVDTINPAPANVTATPDSVSDTDTIGAPTATLAATALPGSIIDVDTVTGPAVAYSTPVAVDGLSDPDSVGQPTLTFTDTPPAYGLGGYGMGLYGVGTPAPGSTTAPTDPVPLSNYGYGAGIYSDGLYQGDSTPHDNPTYGSGTYGYGIYYGATPSTPNIGPLFTDFAGSNRPPLHILGIGPWSPVIRWRGAANYGVGPGNYPARPALPLPPATSKGFTLRLDEGSEARVELNLPRGAGLVIDEMDTDLWWRRKDPRTGIVEVIGRFNTSHVNLQTSDTGLSLSCQFDDYRTVLSNRRIMRYMHPTWDKGTQTQWAKGTPVVEVFKWAIPANTRLDLSELDTYDLGELINPYFLPPGTPLSEVFDSVEALSRNDWEWWIETPNDINAAPKLRFVLGTRGADKGVVLHDLGKGPTPIASWTRNAAADNYANSLMYNGGVDKNGIGGSVVKTIPAQILQYGQRDTTDGNSSLAGDKQLIDARAAKKLAKLASREATYTIRLAQGFWRGRAHIDVGDTVRLVLRLGKETINEKHRVTEIDVAIDDNNLEDVTLTLGTPLPSPDPRSKRSPLQRIVRYLRDYTPPEGSGDIVTEDE